MAEDGKKVRKYLDDEVYSKNLRSLEEELNEMMANTYTLSDLLPADISQKSVQEIHELLHCPTIDRSKTLGEQVVDQISNIVLSLLRQHFKLVQKNCIYIDQTLV